MVGNADQSDNQQIFNQKRQSVRSPIDARLILNIRWFAIAGQLAAILYTDMVLQFDVALGPSLSVIGAAVAMNIFQTRRNIITHLKDDQNFPALVFDMLQLSALLFFTGGLLNPFSTMLLAPVVVSAAILRRRETSALITLFAASISLLAFFHYPLPWSDTTLVLPEMYQFAVWMALVLSAIFIGGYAWRVSTGARRIGEALSEAQYVIAKEQQATALGALATAAAHELGSPLNTITVVSHELAREISEDDPIYDDIALLRREAERCRVILAGLDDLKKLGQLELETPVPLDEVIREIIVSRIDQGMVDYRIFVEPDIESPHAKRRPELVQALENILSNADTFAVSSVAIHINATDEEANITISDDGPGFSASTLARVGQPWNSTRYGQLGHRGLGIFIARTLIETLGGAILFRNGAIGGGEVQMVLPRSALIGEEDIT